MGTEVLELEKNDFEILFINKGTLGDSLGLRAEDLPLDKLLNISRPQFP